MLYMTSFQIAEKQKHEREHEAGKRLLLHAVREEYGLPALPVIGRGEQGKPYFPSYSGIHFNISHTGNLAVCAVSERETGVDIERIRGVREVMLKRVLTPGEQAWVADSANQEEAFIRLWTLKESYIKATGEGLRAELTEVEFNIRAEDGEDRIFCNQKGYCFYQRKIRQDVYLALCMRGECIPAEMKKLNIVF